jgi:hypothetical protein
MEERDKDERTEEREKDERMERRELQDLVERKDLIERTDAGREFRERLELGLSTLPQQVHRSSFAGVLAWCMLGMLTREAVLIGLATRTPSPHGRVVVEAGIDAFIEPRLT